MMDGAAGLMAEADLDRRVGRRAWVERVLEMADGLPPRDRRLLEQVYRHGVCVSHIAQLLGEDRKQTQRRVARLLRRVRRPAFRFATRYPDMIPRPMLPVAHHAIVRGKSQRDTALLTGRPLHQVRDDLRVIAALSALVLGEHT